MTKAEKRVIAAARRLFSQWRAKGPAIAFWYPIWCEYNAKAFGRACIALNAERKRKGKR